jgi:hypothetical protein
VHRALSNRGSDLCLVEFFTPMSKYPLAALKKSYIGFKGLTQDVIKSKVVQKIINYQIEGRDKRKRKEPKRTKSERKEAEKRKKKRT